MGAARVDPCVVLARPVRLVWFVWDPRRGQGAIRLGNAVPPDADGRVSGRADHFSPPQSEAPAVRRNSEAAGRRSTGGLGEEDHSPSDGYGFESHGIAARWRRAL